jgi:16S rRNA (guanine527-N7)-methyltransferase
MKRWGKFGPEEFRAEANVSRETIERLETYVSLLFRWQARMNLVGPGELDDLWRRHIWDSAQLATLASVSASVWADLGSGAGFPGLVLAVMLADRPGFRMHLVESNTRKAAFLRESVRITGAPVTIHAARAETLSPLEAEIITARALYPLPQLLDFFVRHRAPSGIALFPKGEGVEAELTAARLAWSLDAEVLPSRSDPGGHILRIRSAQRRADGHPPG